MADKHLITLEVLREYGVDLSIPHNVEFNIVSLSSIDEEAVRGLAVRHGLASGCPEGWRRLLGNIDGRLDHHGRSNPPPVRGN